MSHRTPSLPQATFNVYMYLSNALFLHVHVRVNVTWPILRVHLDHDARVRVGAMADSDFSFYLQYVQHAIYISVRNES